MKEWRRRLKCIRCSSTFPIDKLKGICSCGGTLLVEYDLEWVQSQLTKDIFINRVPSMWRYHELLPVRDLSAIVSLGEGCTPLIRLTNMEKKLGLRHVYVKREEQNPTGSFKARGFSAAISLANEHGVAKVAVNSNGNAGSALAAYAAYAGMDAYVFLPKDCPGLIVQECMDYSAHTYLVDGFIHDGARIISEGMQDQGWMNVGTLQEPGRVEGKKTMGLEVAEQMGWQLPDMIIYPTGGGSGIIGMWKAFRELQEMGWITGTMPRLISVQEEGCHPLVTALSLNRDDHDLPKDDPTSMPTGLRVPLPPDLKLLTDILHETDGTAIAVNPEEITQAQAQMGRLGISSSPEGAATLAGLMKLKDLGQISATDRVVLFNTSHALKYKPWKLTPPLQPIRTYQDMLAHQQQHP